MQGAVATNPEHDCHAWNHQIWHMQRPYIYSTCGICGQMTKIEKAPELEALQKLCEEQKGEIAELKFVLMQRDAELTMRNEQLEKVRFQSDIYAKQVVLKEELINERSSQLATQTERARVMREALECLCISLRKRLTLI